MPLSSSFQGVGREGFHCTQRCPHFRRLEWRDSIVYRGVQRVSTVYRGVLISGGWNGGTLLYTEVFRGFPLYTEVSSFQGVGIEEFHCMQRCLSSFQGVGIEEFHYILRCPHFRG